VRTAAGSPPCSTNSIHCKAATAQPPANSVRRRPSRPSASSRSDMPTPSSSSDTSLGASVASCADDWSTFLKWSIARHSGSSREGNDHPSSARLLDAAIGVERMVSASFPAAFRHAPSRAKTTAHFTRDRDLSPTMLHAPLRAPRRQQVHAAGNMFLHAQNSENSPTSSSTFLPAVDPDYIPPHAMSQRQSSFAAQDVTKDRNQGFTVDCSILLIKIWNSYIFLANSDATFLKGFTRRDAGRTPSIRDLQTVNVSSKAHRELDHGYDLSSEMLKNTLKGKGFVLTQRSTTFCWIYIVDNMGRGRGRNGFRAGIRNAGFQERLSETFGPVTLFSQLFIARNDLDGALKFIDSMKLYNIAPNTQSWSLLIQSARNRSVFESLIYGYLNFKVYKRPTTEPLRHATDFGLSEASKMFADMLKHGYEPGAHLRLGKHNHSGSVILNDMNARKIPRDSAGELERAIEIFRDMETTGIPITEVTLCALLNAHCINGDMSGAMTVLDAFPRLGLRRGLVARPFRCLSHVRRHDETRCSPAVTTYNTLIAAHVRAGDQEGAMAWYDRLLKSGLDPTLVTFNILIHANVQRLNMIGALDAYTELLRRGLRPDDATFAPLIQGSARKIAISSKEAVRVREAHQYGSSEAGVVTHRPSALTQQVALENVRTFDMLIRAWMEEALKRGVKLDTRLYADGARGMHSMMNEEGIRADMFTYTKKAEIDAAAAAAGGVESGGPAAPSSAPTPFLCLVDEDAALSDQVALDAGMTHVEVGTGNESEPVTMKASSLEVVLEGDAMAQTRAYVVLPQTATGDTILDVEEDEEVSDVRRHIRGGEGRILVSHDSGVGVRT
ncbi:hypothetical protein BC829DRAFT_391222, partial [Chytridium lagenaria]